MAMTPGGKKFVIFAIVVALGGGAGYYFYKSPPKFVSAPAAIVETLNPATIKEPVLVIPVKPAVEKVEAAVKKHVVAHKVNKKVGSVPRIKSDHDTLVHKDVKKEMSTDDALNALAGKDKL